MTKKQIIIVSVIAAVLITAIIAVVLHNRSSNSVASAGFQTQSIERREIPSGTVEANQSEETDQFKTADQSKGSNNSSTNSRNTSLNASGTIVYDPSLFEEVPIKTAPPETSGYSIPKSHHFYDIHGSVDLNDKHKAKLVITIDRGTNFQEQLQELNNIIEPILGTKTAEEIVAYVKTKTSPSVVLDRWWKTESKKIKVSSSFNSNYITFQSWDK